MPRSEPEISSRLPSIAVAFARGRGVKVDEILERYGLPSDLQPQTVLHLQASALNSLVDEVSALTQEVHLGLELARLAPRGAYGVAEFALRASPQLAELCENFVRFNGIISPDQVFRYQVQNDECHVYYGPRGSRRLGRHQETYGTALMVGALRTLLGDLSMSKISFTFTAPADPTPFTAFFGHAPMTFSAPEAGLSFPRTMLARPLTTADPALYRFLEEHALAALASRPRSDDLTDRLRQAIREAVKQGEPNMERLSTRLHMSARTLQRRLADAGTTFQQVLDEVRFDLARQYLKDDRLDVSEIAYLLGYSELRAFDRAFRRWASVTPGDWRSRPQ